jgi:hypothetical protein
LEPEQEQGELDRLRKENEIMRGLIADSNMECIYCGLPKAEMAKCPSGFPGCGRGDDILLTVSVREILERNRMLSDIALSAVALKLNIEHGGKPYLHALKRDLDAFSRRFGDQDAGHESTDKPGHKGTRRRSSRGV